MLGESARSRRGSICLVPSDLNYLYRNGGIGSYFWHMAHLLASRKWRVHILYAGPVEDRQALADMPRRLGRAGIHFTHCEDLKPPRAHEVSPYAPAWYAQLSDRVRHALEDLHRIHHFDLIEFGDLNCYGFRSVQAKRTAGAFPGSRIIVKLHGTSQWLRDGNHWPMQQADELRLDFCERYAFEHADVQMSPCRYMLDYVRSTGWNVRPEARVVPYAFPAARQAPRPLRAELRTEVVFFGRLETRKGLEIFVEAARQLDRRTPITFLGKDTVLAGGVAASELIKQKLEGRSVSLRTDFNQERAVTYLQEGNRLAVISSLADNFPNTVIECAVNGIPFVASRVGGIPEILWDGDLQEHLLFEPTATDLGRCLKGYLNSDLGRRQQLRDLARSVTNVPTNHRLVAEAYEQLLNEAPSGAAFSLPSLEPRVSVLVRHRDAGESLPESLRCLSAQTFANLEVLVVDDGSTCPDSLRILAEQRALYPQFQFLRPAAASTGAACDSALAAARGDYVVAIAGDHLCVPNMVERLANLLGSNPGLAALSCYVLRARQAEDIAAETFTGALRPTAGPRLLAALENVYGEAAIFRSEALRAVGGFGGDREPGTAPWDVFLKLVGAGYEVDVVPEYLSCRLNEAASSVNVSKAVRRSLAPFAGSGPLPVGDQLGLLDLLISSVRRCEEQASQLQSLQASNERLSGHVEHLARVGHDLDWHVRHLQRHAGNVEHGLTDCRDSVQELHEANEQLRGQLKSMRYRVADRLNQELKKVPLVQGTVKGSIYTTWLVWKGLKSAGRLSSRLFRQTRATSAAP